MAIVLNSADLKLPQNPKNNTEPKKEVVKSYVLYGIT